MHNHIRAPPPLALFMGGYHTSGPSTSQQASCGAFPALHSARSPEPASAKDNHFEYAPIGEDVIVANDFRSSPATGVSPICPARLAFEPDEAGTEHDLAYSPLHAGSPTHDDQRSRSVA